MSSISVHNAVKLKLELEERLTKKIAAELAWFEQQTSLTIQSVYVESAEATRIEDVRRRVLVTRFAIEVLL